MTRVEIGSIVKTVKKWNPCKDAPNDYFLYVDISSVDKSMKEIVEATQIRGLNAPGRAQQLLNSGDILVSTVRPNLNGVAFVHASHHNATASTGYCVLRPDLTKINARYLFQWVRTPQFIDEMILNSSGANYPAVTDKIVKVSKIPLPPLEHQKLIADVLDKADELRRKRQAALAKLDELLKSVFLDMFGDPVTNPKGWTIKSIEDVSIKVTDGEHTTPRRVKNGIKLFVLVKTSSDTSSLNCL
ncbi:MAG: restriction endonuclease subunit S [Trueperaceae bacterium]|nr:restriction endonuclease subunit S [Trueperaceae bacterium]